MKAGDYLMLSTGEYSDYSFSGPYKILKDFTFGEIVEEIKENFKPSYEGDEIDNYSVAPYLIKRGYIEDVENCTEVHCGSYGRLEIDHSLLSA